MITGELQKTRHLLHVPKNINANASRKLKLKKTTKQKNDYYTQLYTMNYIINYTQVNIAK